MTRFGGTAAMVMAGLLVSACSTLVGPRVASLPPTPIQPVVQAPLGPVAAAPAADAGQQSQAQTEQPGALDPATGEQTAGAAEDDATSAAGLSADLQTPGTAATPNTQVAATDSRVGRSDLLGGWKIAAGPDQCQLFMNLTAWKGGYRATTRGCSSPALQNVSAWDLNGNQVTLKDGNGAAIGSAYKTGPDRFSGQTAGGTRIAFYR